MHLLNASDLPQFSPNDLLSILQPIIEKKILATVYSTFMVHETWKKKSFGTRSPLKKIYSHIRLQIFHWCMGLEKINLTGPSPKKTFSFLTTVLLWCTRLGRFLIGIRPHRKKIVFSYWTCWELPKNCHRYSTPTEIELFLATVLLWSAGYKNYSLVLR